MLYEISKRGVSMSKVFLPEGYQMPLSVYEMQRAIEFIKSEFQRNLRIQLHLKRTKLQG